MKVLFMGVGLTDYYNQVLNKLNSEPDIEILNIAVSSGKGHTGEGVHQTTEGIDFEVKFLKEVVFSRLSELSYKGFEKLNEVLHESKPDIIVTTETYVKYLYSDEKVSKLIRDNHIKVIMKDIPFRLKKYEEEIKEIRNGEKQKNYSTLLEKVSELLFKKIKLNHVHTLLKKISSKTGANSLFNKVYVQNVLLKKINLKKEILNLVDAHVNYVEEAYELFGSYGVSKEKIFITLNSPDTDLLFEIRKKIEEDPKKLTDCSQRLIHIGRLIPWKRTDMLIRSFKKVKETYPKAELLIIGTGPEEASLKKLGHDLGLDDSVFFLGGVYKPEEIGMYLIESTAYVLAGMGGISINDAMIFGKPVICSVCDGTEKKLVYDGANGYYFKDGDEGDLTEKIIKLLSNTDRIKEMGQESTNIIKNKVNIHTVISGYRKAFDYVLNKI